MQTLLRTTCGLTSPFLVPSPLGEGSLCAISESHTLRDFAINHRHRGQIGCRDSPKYSSAFYRILDLP